MTVDSSKTVKGGGSDSFDAWRKSVRPEFLPIDASTLHTGSSLGFSIYSSTSGSGRVLAVPPEDVFTDEAKQRFANSQVGLYILWKDREKHQAHLTKYLDSLLNIKREEAGRLAYDISRTVMMRVLEHPDKEALVAAQQAADATAELIMASNRALAAMVRLARHDNSTFTHSCNVGLFGLGLVKSLTARGARLDVRALGTAFFLHDLGKVAINPELLNKSQPLDSMERKEVEGHCRLGVDILRELDFVTPEASLVALQHHERQDGSGYPEGLEGKEIHFFARICAIADVYEALTSDRPQRLKMKPFEALTLMQQEMAGQFDPDLLRLFVLMLR